MSRNLWIATFALSVAALMGGFVYALQLPSGEGGPLPLLIGAPFAILARVSWRRLRRTA